MQPNLETEITPADLQQKQEIIRGRFRPGESGNKAGRRVGSRNRASLMAQNLILADIEAISEKLVEMAKSGNIEAIKLIFTRLVPPARERAVKFEAPKIKSVADLMQTLSNVVEAMAKGEITPLEASSVTNVLERLRRLSENEEFEARLKELEVYAKARIEEQSKVSGKRRTAY